MTDKAKQDYVRSKTVDLFNFGYKTVTEEHVKEQLERVLRNEGQLTVIGYFIKDDYEKALRNN